MSQTQTLNLTPLFLIWSAFFIAATFITGDLNMLWWAAAPWLFVLAFGFVMFLFGVTFMYAKYRQGERIKVTTRKGVRYVQRGRDAQWVVRNH